MTTTPNKQNREVPRWVWVLVTVVVAALVVGVSVVFSKNRESPAPPSAAPAPTIARAGADGCIAGRNNDAKSLIAGARKQPHTEGGAAATAAGLLRFMFQYPWPSEKELALMMSELSTVDSSEIPATAKFLRQTPGPREARTAGYSIADGRYSIEPSSTENFVVVSIDAAAITDGRLNGESLVKTFTMAWDGQVWKLDGSDDSRADESNLENGVAFVGGC